MFASVGAVEFVPGIAGRGYFDDGFRRFDVDCQHGDFHAPDRVEECVVLFVDCCRQKEGVLVLELRVYIRGGIGGGEKRVGRTPTKVLSKSGEARVENPVCLVCFGDTVDDDAV